MAESIARQVASYLKNHPKASNAELYTQFPSVRENTLRNYKSKFRGYNHQNKSTRKTITREQPQTNSPNKAIVSSLRGKVFNFFKQNPGASNQTLYEEFSNDSKNKLRHYKASFFKSIGSSAQEILNAKKVEPKSKHSTPKEPINLTSLNRRLKKLEVQVGLLSQHLESSTKPAGIVKSGISEKASSAEKRILELEDNLLSFIQEKRKKIKNEISSLDEIQQTVSEKINAFLKKLREKR